MRNKKLMLFAIIWATSIIVLGSTSSTYLVEKIMEVFNFEFSSKEIYGMAVEIMHWVRWLYFGALAFLTFYLCQRQHI